MFKKKNKTSGLPKIKIGGFHRNVKYYGYKVHTLNPPREINN